MASPNQLPTFRYFKISWPLEYVAHIEINRPEKMNAFIEDMWLELRIVFDTLSTASFVRAVVLSGAGNRAFTTGLDLQQASKKGPLSANVSKQGDPARAATSIRRHLLEIQDCVSTIEKCEKPVICVMHGYAFGLAIDISTCADVRICSEDTKFSVKEVDVGLAADVGTLSRLPKLVGSTSWVKDVSLTARTFGSDEALKVGLVSAVHSNKEIAIIEGIKWAALIASKSPVAVQGTKELLNWSQDHSIKDGLRYTQVWNSAFLQTDDLASVKQASTLKKKPIFAKL